MLFNHPSDRPTKAEKLLTVLRDGEPHATKELVRRVGHTFGGAVFKLRRNGYDIARQGHPSKRYQHEYQLTELDRD